MIIHYTLVNIAGQKYPKHIDWEGSYSSGVDFIRSQIDYNEIDELILHQPTESDLMPDQIIKLKQEILKRTPDPQLQSKIRQQINELQHELHLKQIQSDTCPDCKHCSCSK